MSLTSDSEGGILSMDQSDFSLVDDDSSGGSKNRGFLLKKGPWTSAEDAVLVEYVKKHGEGNWNAVQKHSGLFRCGKSCRLRWANHLRPNLKKGAFTTEEEQLIIELHAKMGNKWARMAAHLPGRTDNEIKNYWNTRVKRCRRAGLPLYPPELCPQTFQENQQMQSAVDIHSSDVGNLLQTDSGIPEVVFESLQTNQGALPFVAESCDISACGMLVNGLTSEYDNFVSPVIRRPKRDKKLAAPLFGYDSHVRNNSSSFNSTGNDRCATGMSESLDFLHPYDSVPITQNPVILGVDHYQGGQSLTNGNFSASLPTPGAVKLELPSLQYPETDFCSWPSSSPPVIESVDAFIQSPPVSEAFLSDSCSMQNSGLLDALLHEAQKMSSAKNVTSEKTSSSGNTLGSSESHKCTEEMKDHDDPHFPLGSSTSGNGTLFEETSLDETFSEGCEVKPEPIEQAWTCDADMKEFFTHMDHLRPDALLGSRWIEPCVASEKDQNIMTDTIAALIGDDSGCESKSIGTEAHMISKRRLNFGSCTWNNMPAVCHMSEFP